jgi:hypothetical protein
MNKEIVRDLKDFVYTDSEMNFEELTKEKRRFVRVKDFNSVLATRMTYCRMTAILADAMILLNDPEVYSSYKATGEIKVKLDCNCDCGHDNYVLVKPSLIKSDVLPK